MIISASRIATASGGADVGGHVFSGPKNESIEVVMGGRRDLDNMVNDARLHGAKYAIRHFKISPEQATTREQAFESPRPWAGSSVSIRTAACLWSTRRNAGAAMATAATGI